MAVEMWAVVPGMTKDQYDQFADLLTKLKTEPGFIAHIAGPSEGGYRVTEFWESQEDSDRFIRESSCPACSRLVGSLRKCSTCQPTTWSRVDGQR
jgi:hypothetical protein